MTAVQPADVEPWIRQAARADLLDVFRIERGVFEQPWPYAAFERQLETPGFLVAGDGPTGAGADATSVAGYVVADEVRSHGRPLGHVKNLAVHPDRQGEGVGSALLSRALDVLAAGGARSVKLEVRASNRAARGLYEGFGFEHLRTLPGYYADGEDALVLVGGLADRDGF